MIFVSLVVRGESRCCARCPFEGVWGESGREDMFFEGIGVVRLRWVYMVVVVCEMGYS